jgi:putative glutamine amidotransferase
MKAPRVLVSFRLAEKAEAYLAALRAAGIDPVPCEPGTLEAIAGVHGLVLTGGSDISPGCYGQEPELELGEVDRERDAFELRLMAIADKANLPTLAICRGIQLLNVHRGGSLVQHLPQSARHRRNDTPKGQAVHAVRIEEGSVLAGIMGTECQVNSRHHQSLDRVGRGLIVTARDAEDGVIEAVEDPARRFLVGVQWHPEDQAPLDGVQRRLFEAFASALQR